MPIPKVSASASDTLDQTSYTQIDSMTLTPGAGDFLATFSMDVTYNSSPGSQTLKIAIYVNGVQQQHSIRTVQQNSSVPSMTVGVVTSAYVSPTAGQVVEVRYIASSATAPMAGTTRELTLLPAEQTNYQDTATANDTIASATWTTLNSMTRTPAAGDYLLVFTTSASTPADEDVAFRLSVGGSPVAHTERQLSVEGSADPSSYCVLIAASISPNGSQVVEIEWARITGTGTQTCYERNMILIEVDSTDIFQATGTVDDSESTSGTDKQIDDMLITDPGANDYLVLFSSHRYYGALAAPGATTTIKIYEGGAEDTNLTRLFEHEDSIDATVMPVFTTGRVTLGVSTDDIAAYWRGDSTDVRTMYERTLVAVGDPSPAATPQAGWVFGKADTEINFTNTSYAEKLTLEFNAPAAGDYLIVVSCQGALGSTTASIGIRAQLDDTTTIMEALHEPISSLRIEEYKNFSTVYLAESLASGDHFVDLDALVESSTGYMRYMKIAVIRLDDWMPTTGMYDYAATEGEATPGTSWGTQQTLTFTPDVAGDYLILASAELKAGQNTRNINARLNYDSAAEYLPLNNSEESGNNYVGYESKDTTDYMAFVWGGIVNIPASSKTILLESVMVSGTTARIRKRRIIAIRIAAMDSSAITDEDTAVTSTTSAWSEKSTITFTPGSTADYLIFGGIVLKPDSASWESQGRLEQTAGTGTGTIGKIVLMSKDASNPADIFPFFTLEIKSLTNVSQTFKTQWGAVASGTHYSKGSFIIAIRKPAGVATNSVTLLSDARIADTYSVQLLSDGRIFDVYSIQLLSDARIKKAFSVQLLSDGRIKGPVSVQLLSDGRIFDVYSVQLLSDARIQEINSVTLLSDARIADTYSVQLLSDGRIFDTYSVQLLSDAKIVLASFSITLNSDARIKKAFSVQLLSDGRIFDIYSIQLLSDARIKKAFSVQLLSDARIKAPVFVQLLSDGRIFDTYSVQLLSDAKVKLTDVFSVTLLSDARIKKDFSVTLLSDGRIFDVYLVQLLSDGRIKKAFSVQLLSDGRIFDTYSIQLLSDARIKDTYSVTLLSDAKITGKNQIQLLSDSRIKKAFSVQLPSDARVILGPIIDLHEITIIIEKHNEIKMIVEKTNEITMEVIKENEIKMIVEKQGIER